jgi:ribose/xylose/arabinose/galactoside ABC-type transport system permease subunit
MTGAFDAVLAILAGLALGVAVGVTNGLLIGFSGLRSTVVTLAVGAICMAFALQHLSIENAPPPEVLQKILLGMRVDGISIWPLSTIVGICLVGAAILQTRFGRAIRLIGAGATLASALGWYSGLMFSLAQGQLSEESFWQPRLVLLTPQPAHPSSSKFSRALLSEGALRDSGVDQYLVP